jgi:TetR/AcrR family transcriptional repressor of nem operon
MARPRRQDDTELLAAAMQLFWRNGYSTTGIRELEQGLGLRAPALYHRFGSKEQLFLAALQQYVEQIIGARIKRYLQQQEQPLTGLRAFFDTTYDYVSATQPPLGCLVLNTSLEALSADPAVASELTQAARRVRTAIRTTLRRAQALGQLDQHANVRALTDTLYLGLQGLLVTSKLIRDPALLRRQVDSLFALLPVTAATTEGARP